MFILALVAGTVLAGLLAGLYFGYACSVIPALREVDDPTYVDVMRRINRAIQNPLFGLAFLGSLVLPLAAGFGLLVERPSAATATLLGAGCSVMSAVVTFAGNTPRNIQLDRSVGAGARQAFERPWNRSHLVRTALSVASLVLLCRALLLL